MIHKHEPHQEVGDIELFRDEQIAERRNSVPRRIRSIKQRERSRPKEFNNLGRQLSNTMFKNLLMKIEVVEVYSPPRVTMMAEEMGFRAGWALDLTTCDKDGRPWDFDQLEVRSRAAHRVMTDKPTLLIGRPMCTVFSQMNNINYPKMDPS